jgi:thymidylate kinase
MIYVEMCGSPGSGKSTLVERIVKELKFAGKTVLTEKDLHIKSKLLSLINKLVLLISPKDFKLKKELIKYWLQFGFRLHSFRYLIRILEVKQYIYSRKKLDFLVLDEGIVQHLTSIGHGNKINISYSLINHLKNSIYNDNSILIKCDLSINLIKERLIKRQKANDRFIKSDDLKMTNIIKLKIENIDYILELMNLDYVFLIETTNLTDAIEQSMNLFKL